MAELDFDLRCYPEKSLGRVAADHLARYNFCKEFVKGKKVLDISCGEGYGSEILNQAGAAKIWGIDNDAEIIAQAKLKYPSVNFLTAEAAKIPLPDQFFDVIVSFETWHYLEQYQDFMAELHRLLKPQGLLILSVPNKNNLYLKPFNHQSLTKYYKVNFNEAKIKALTKKYFVIKNWYGQRLIKKIYANGFIKLGLWVLGFISAKWHEKINNLYKLGNGPAVQVLNSNFSPRYFVIVCQKKN